jgi:hypothetical protein
LLKVLYTRGSLRRKLKVVFTNVLSSHSVGVEYGDIKSQIIDGKLHVFVMTLVELLKYLGQESVKGL